MKKCIPLLILLLSACQSQNPETCPLTQLDTREQQALCHRLKAENSPDPKRAAYVRDKMNELNCGLYF